MRKQELASLAVIGIGAGVALSGCQKGSGEVHHNEAHQDHQQGSNGQHMSAEMEAFYNNLSPEGKRKFMSLDAHHKMMAVEMANQQCNGKNECAGMGGCKTAHHNCAGKNSCKGQGGEPVHDPNKVVMIQYTKQLNHK